MITAAELARLQSTESPIIQTLVKVGVPGLARAGFIPEPVEIKSTLEIPVPRLGVGPNGVPQRVETLNELANRIMSPETAVADFGKFALMFSLALDRGGKSLPMDIVDTAGVGGIAESAGYDIRSISRDPATGVILRNPESNLLNGIYFAQMYLKAMITSDNNPGIFIKQMEQLATAVEDFRLDRPQVIEILQSYPTARAVVNYFTNPEVVCNMQGPTQGDPKIDLKIVMDSILFQIRRGGPVVGIAGIGMPLPGRWPAGESLSREAEAQLGYAVLEAIGWRDAINHRRVLREGNPPGPYRYRWSLVEENKHIFGLPQVADPFSAAARPVEFVDKIKQRFGKNLEGVGLDTLDVEYRTYAAEVLKRAVARGVSFYGEIQWEAEMDERMVSNDPFGRGLVELPSGSLINGRTPLDLRIDYRDTSNQFPRGTCKRYPEGTVINGIDLGGQEISVGMVRNIKKHHKAADLWGALYELYLNPYQKIEEPFVKAVNAAAEYGKESFGDVLSVSQRERYIPRISSAVMKIANLRGMPVSEEIIKRTMNSMKDELGMYRGFTGFFRGRFREAVMAGYNESAKAKGRNIAPAKGDTDWNLIQEFVKNFWGSGK